MDYNLMVLINSGLAGIVIILCAIVAWYFKKDINANNEIVLQMKASNEIESKKVNALQIQVRIIARNMDIEIGND